MAEAHGFFGFPAASSTSFGPKGASQQTPPAKLCFAFSVPPIPSALPLVAGGKRLPYPGTKCRVWIRGSGEGTALLNRGGLTHYASPTAITGSCGAAPSSLTSSTSKRSPRAPHLSCLPCSFFMECSLPAPSPTLFFLL